MKLRIVVPGKIVGKNEARGINNRGPKPTLFKTSKMKLWQRKIAVAAWATATQAGWPDPFLVAQASFKVYRYNVGGDYDRGMEYVADALQFSRWWTPKGLASLPGPVGIIGNDKDLYSKGSPPTIVDDGGPRIEIVIELKKLRAPVEAKAKRERWYELEQRRTAKRMKKALEKKTTARVGVQNELAEIQRRTGMEFPF